MELCESNLRFNRYTLTYTPRHPKLHFYYFQVTEADGTLHIIHANESMRGELNLHSDRYWQLTVYDGRAKTPGWRTGQRDHLPDFSRPLLQFRFPETKCPC